MRRDATRRDATPPARPPGTRAAALEAAMAVILEPFMSRVIWYADDVGLKGTTPDELLDTLNLCLGRLEEYRLFANPTTATLFARRLAFLGRVISAGGSIALDSAYVEGVVAMAPPPSAWARALIPSRTLGVERGSNHS
jgi:hypothetical protein